jgi:hypothetical protein
MRMRGLALLATLLLPLPLLAQTYNYTYTGNDFQDVAGVFPPTPPYSTSDFVTVTFTLAAPLPDNQGIGTEVFPLSWSVSDGVQSNTSADVSADAQFYFRTNGSGTILNWGISDYFGLPDGAYIETDLEPNDLGLDFDEGYNGTGRLEYDAAERYNPGVWTVSESSVPEGSSFPLLLLSGTCLLGAGLFRFRRKSRTAGAA